MGPKLFFSSECLYNCLRLHSSNNRLNNPLHAVFYFNKHMTPVYFYVNMQLL
jgi:hypothetical protein